MRRLYLGLQHALRPGRIFNRLRQLFPRRKDKTTGRGGFCYLPDGELLYIPPAERGDGCGDRKP